jgi:uncharacterized membrane-anchored protein YhcB (DUF1043 family)
MIPEPLASFLTSTAPPLLGVAIGGTIGYLTTRMQVRAQKDQLETQLSRETSRRRAEFYLEKKVDALIEMYSVVKRARDAFRPAMSTISTQPESFGIEDFEEIRSLHFEYRRKQKYAQIFLDDEQTEAAEDLLVYLNSLTGQLKNIVEFSQQKERQYDVDFDLMKYNQHFSDAENFLKEEVKGPIDEIE